MAVVIKLQTGSISYQCDLGNNCLVKKHVDKIRLRNISYQPKPGEQPYLEVEAAEPQTQQAEQCQTLPSEPASINEAECNLSAETPKVYPRRIRKQTELFQAGFN